MVVMKHEIEGMVKDYIKENLRIEVVLTRNYGYAGAITLGKEIDLILCDEVISSIDIGE